MPSSTHEIGELVLINQLPGMVIEARRANNDILSSGKQTSNCYPLVHYVLLNTGNVEGPFFSMELKRVS